MILQEIPGQRPDGYGRIAEFVVKIARAAGDRENFAGKRFVLRFFASADPPARSG